MNINFSKAVKFNLFDPCIFLLQNPLIPDHVREAVVSHIVSVHQSVGDFSKKFQQKLRRNNYVTPKNYLDFINTYLKLLEEKDKINLAQVTGNRDNKMNSSVSDNLENYLISKMTL